MGEKLNAVLAEVQALGLQFDLLSGGGMDVNLETLKGQTRICKIKVWMKNLPLSLFHCKLRKLHYLLQEQPLRKKLQHKSPHLVQ